MVISKEEICKYIKRLSVLYLDVKRAEAKGYSFFELRDGTVLSEALKCVLSLLHKVGEQMTFDYVDTDSLHFHTYLDIASVYPKFKAKNQTKADIKTLNSLYGTASKEAINKAFKALKDEGNIILDIIDEIWGGDE